MHTSNSRIDEVQNAYSPVEKIEKITSILFWASVGVSLISNQTFYTIGGKLASGLSIFFIITVLLHAVLSNLNAFWLIPNAERARRKQLLSDSLNIPLTQEVTVGYYNNTRPPSIHRLGLNIFENSFFGMKICNEMFKKGAPVIIIFLISWITLIYNRNTDLKTAIVVTQIIFSADVIFKWIRVGLLSHRLKILYDSLYSLFLDDSALSKSKLNAKILDCFAEYESAKACASVKQSSKIFHKLNDELSQEWDRIKSTLKIT